MKFKTLTLSLLLGLAASSTFAEDRYLVRVPAHVDLSSQESGTPAPSEPIAVNLFSIPAEKAKVGVHYSKDFTSLLSISGGSGAYDIKDVSWSFSPGSMAPDGLTLNGNGVLSGTPSSIGEYSFSIDAKFESVTGSQNYQLKVSLPLLDSLWDIGYSSVASSADGGRTARVVNLYSIPAKSPLPKTGKFYWEVTPVGLDTYAMVGVGTKPVGIHSYATSCQAYESNSGSYIGGGVSVVNYSTSKTTRTFGLAFDADTKKLDVYRGNVKLFTCTFTTTLDLYAIAGTGSSESTVRADFQPEEMTYAPPEGYTAGIPAVAQ